MERKFRKSWNPYPEFICSESHRPSFFTKENLAQPEEMEILKFEKDAENWTCVTNQRIVGRLAGDLSGADLAKGLCNFDYFDCHGAKIDNKSQTDAIFSIGFDPHVGFSPRQHRFFIDGAKAYALANILMHLVYG